MDPWKMLRKGNTSRELSMRFLTTGIFLKIVHVYLWSAACDLFFRTHSLSRLSTTEAYISSLPKHHQSLLLKYRSHLDDVRTCVEHNYEIIKLIISDVATLFENVKHDANKVKL